MLQQGLAAELGQHVDRIDSRVNKVTQDEVDNSILTAEWDGRLGPFLGERRKPGSLTAGEYDAQHADPHKFSGPLFQAARHSGKQKIHSFGHPARMSGMSQTSFRR